MTRFLPFCHPRSCPAPPPGQTSVDVAARAGTAALARRLEVGALFSGHLMMKVPRLLGLGAEWKPRWVVASPRYPCPRAAGDGVVRRTLACYKVADVTSPVCKAWLDGSAARSAVGSRGHLQCELVSPVWGAGGGVRRGGGGWEPLPLDKSPLYLHAPTRLLPGLAPVTCAAGGRTPHRRGRRGIHPPLSPSRRHCHGVGCAAAVHAGRKRRCVWVEGVGKGSVGREDRSGGWEDRSGGWEDRTGRWEERRVRKVLGGRRRATRSNAVSSPPNPHTTPSSCPASLSVAERRESDDELARRLQEQYDAEAARYLVQNPDAPSPVQQPRLPVAARARPAVVPLELPAAEPVAASAPRLPDDAFFGGMHSPAVTALRTSSAAPGDGSSWNDSTPSPSRASAAGRQASAPLSDGPSGSAPCPPARQQALQAVPVQDGRLPATDVASMRLPSPGSDGEDEESCVVCMAAPASAGFLHGDRCARCLGLAGLLAVACVLVGGGGCFRRHPRHGQAWKP